MDLPDQMASQSKQHPLSEGKPGVGYECKAAYIQLRGDSMRFDYSQHPADGYFIDGEHTFDNVYVETSKIVRQSPSLIIWHDCDVPEVLEAVQDAMQGEPYDLFRVTDTRIVYAVKQSLL